MSESGGSGRPPPGGPPWPPQGQWPQQPQQQPAHGQWPQQPQQPYPQQPQQPYPQQPQQPYPQQPWPQQQPPQHQRPPTQPPAGGASLGTAFGRAFRLRIDPSEVTDHERNKLMSAGITSPTVQAFLAWRRSVLIMAAIGILPILGFHFYDMSKSEGEPEALKTLSTVLLIVDVSFAILLWSQIGRWTSWRKQRRVLLWGWLLFFLMPFLLYLYPLRDALMGALTGQLDAPVDPAAKKIGTMVIGMTVALASMIDLAPKAVALLPGIMRAAITSKLLFPGASGPGWLILLMAPIYAVIMYIVLIVPYQLTGNGVFVGAMVGLIGAQLWLGRMGYKLARPERLDEAIALIRRVRTGYLLLSVAGAVFVLIGLVDVLKMFDLPIWFTVKLVITLLVNTLLLALVATDLLVDNLARGQLLLAEPGVGQAFATFQRDVSQFADPVISSKQQPR